MNKRKLQNKECKKYFLKNQKAITLIALVISIIVMLILAGVSLNATIGENGIITQAKNATYIQSIAVLEEFLNNYYIEHYDEFSDADNKAEAMQKNHESENWIYNPSKNGFGSVGYVVNENGQACYLIEKKSLPKEIREQLQGGDAKDGSYASYSGMIDVYGVTSNLKVYYSNNGIENLKGISESELDLDNPARLVFSAGSNYAKLITGDNTSSLNANDCKSIKALTINSDDGINNLKDLYNFPSLEEITLTNINFENLIGIQNAVNLKKITIQNCTITSLDGLSSSKGVLDFVVLDNSEILNYKALCNLNNLKYLYLLRTSDNEIEKLCSNDLGIGNYDFNQLTKFGIMGSESVLQTDSNINASTRNSKVTNISALKNLSSTTKETIKYLFLNNNNISTIQELTDFKNVLTLHCETNMLENLKGIESMQNLTQLYACNNMLGNLEIDSEKQENDGIKSLENITTLEKIDLRSNQIIWIDYIKNCENIQLLYLSGNTRLNNVSLLDIKTLCIKCGGNFNISNNYSLLLLDENTNLLDLSWQNVAKSNFELITGATNLELLNLEGMKLSDDAGNIISGEDANEIYNNVLKSFKKLKRVNLSSLGDNLTTIEFIRNGDITGIIELELFNTNVTTGTKNEAGEFSGLEILNNYSESLGNLELTTKTIDLSQIQGVICKLYANNKLGYWKNRAFSGLCCYDSDIIKTLEKCYDITELALYSNLNNIGNIDLTQCENLKNILLNSVTGKIKLPSNDFENIMCWNVNDIFDFSNISSIDFFRINARNAENFKNIIDSLNENAVIKEMKLYQNCSGVNFSCFEDCKTINILKINAFCDPNCGTNPQTTSVKGLSKIRNLEELTINGTAYMNLKDIDDLDNLRNLKSFISTNTCINSLYGLRNLIKLEYLDLSNNCIYERTNNSDGEIINNLQILANLNPNSKVEPKGSLQALFMAGNTGIINWNLLKNLKWQNGKSGF